MNTIVPSYFMGKEKRNAYHIWQLKLSFRGCVSNRRRRLFTLSFVRRRDEFKAEKGLSNEQIHEFDRKIKNPTPFELQ